MATKQQKKTSPETAAPANAPVPTLEQKMSSFYKLQRDRLEIAVIQLTNEVQALQAENEALRAQITPPAEPSEAATNG